ncbi:FAD/NAD(P)-binding domain-containing protein [Hyaloscypha hepaticicola]|uniref:FAD/NAD(P)-binding domain-containing protein n=1 Tax=Hyaloscypha hepaticicola TaxID=2082293 RepID=A0A2J6PZY0_9HELO|nr:FAD/NAD(P)-binding domain-containing protein [Hyaloscypha hepaticicola]
MALPGWQENPALHVLIIGAGVTGLLIAQGLKKNGIDYSIFESDSTSSRPRSREWGMSIHWSRPLLKELLPEHLLGKIGDAQVDPTYDTSNPKGYAVPFYNGKTGDHIVDIPMVNAIRVSRRKMRALCSEGINIQYGKKLVSIASTVSDVTVTFADGTNATGSVCIGTDGAQSAVRQLALPGDAGKAIPLDVILYNMDVCYGDAERAKAVRKVHFMNSVALHPEKNLSIWTSIQEVPDAQKPETWHFQIMPTWLADGKTHEGGANGLAELRELANHLAEPWKSSILWIPETTDVKCNSVSYWPTRHWDSQRGTLTLAGDSAHPVPPHRGQGLNHGIADAHNFIKAVLEIKEGKKSKHAAIEEYNAELVKRGADEVETSRRNALLVHDFEKFMDSPVLKQGYAKSKVN